MIKKTKMDWRVLSVAIVALTALELGALFNGINGAMFSFVVGVIALLAGLTMPQLKFK